MQAKLAKVLVPSKTSLVFRELASPAAQRATSAASEGDHFFAVESAKKRRLGSWVALPFVKQLRGDLEAGQQRARQHP